MNIRKFIRCFAAFALPLVMLMLSPDIANAENTDEASRFTDVLPGHWYYSAIEYVVTNGYFNGVSEELFAPEATMTRAMFVTVLGRMAGIDPTAYQLPNFMDVAPGSYYSGYVAWASENNIVQGLEPNLFGSGVSVTREQVAVFLYRYARHIGMDTSVGQIATPNSTFDGGSNVSKWAVSAMVWATNKGIMRGTGSIMEPQEQITRAQVAQMLLNFSKLMEN